MILHKMLCVNLRLIFPQLMINYQCKVMKSKQYQKAASINHNACYDKFKRRLRLKVTQKSQQQRQAEKRKLLGEQPKQKMQFPRSTHLRVLSLPCSKRPPSPAAAARTPVAAPPADPPVPLPCLPLTLNRSLSQNLYIVQSSQRLRITDQLKERETKIIEQMKIGLVRKLSQGATIEAVQKSRLDIKKERSHSRLIILDTQARMISMNILDNRVKVRKSGSSEKHERTSIMNGKLDLFGATKIIQRYFKSALNSIESIRKWLKRFEKNMLKNGQHRSTPIIVSRQRYLVDSLKVDLLSFNELNCCASLRYGINRFQINKVIEINNIETFHDGIFNLSGEIIKQLKYQIRKSYQYLNIFKIFNQLFYATINCQKQMYCVRNLQNGQEHYNTKINIVRRSTNRMCNLLQNYCESYKKSIQGVQQQRKYTSDKTIRIDLSDQQNTISYSALKSQNYKAFLRLFNCNYIVTLKPLSNYTIRIQFKQQKGIGIYHYIQTTLTPTDYTALRVSLSCQNFADLSLLLSRLGVYNDRRLYHRIKLQHRTRASEEQLQILNALPSDLQFIGNFTKKINGEYYLIRALLNSGNQILFIFVTLPQSRGGYWTSLMFHHTLHSPQILFLLVSAAKVLESSHDSLTMCVAGLTVKLVQYSEQVLLRFSNRRYSATTYKDRLILYNIDSLCSFRSLEGVGKLSKNHIQKLLERTTLLQYQGNRRVLKVWLEGGLLAYTETGTNRLQGNKKKVQISQLKIQFVDKKKSNILMSTKQMKARLIRCVGSVIQQRRRREISQRTLMQGLAN